MEEEEGEGEKGSSQEVAESCQVGNGAVVWVHVPGPEEEHQDPADVEEEGDLEEGGHQVGGDEDGGGGGVAGLGVDDGESEDDVPGDHQEEEESGRVGVVV